jgi:hypothetical protein
LLSIITKWRGLICSGGADTSAMMSLALDDPATFCFYG